MAFTVGETIGDYQIVGILGTGGMGKVYKVRNTISDRVEAMKVLLPDLAHEPELADRFTREIKLLASLNHPNIAALHTAMHLNNQLLMFMEFVEGHTLEERLKEGPIPAADAVNCISQVLAALGYAHERGVVHRDIKPANMMVTAGGEVKLMDFGIAKAVADRRLTMTGTTLGSLYYMSPEQVKGSLSLDGRSDLYSVGVSLYEMVTGTRPFKGDSDYSIMVAHLEQQPVPPMQVDPKLPPALNEAILCAIEKDPARRFQSAQAFRGALLTMGLGAAPKPMPQPMPTTPGPQPPRPQPAPPPPAVAAAAPVAPPPQLRPSTHRGLWMALGALVVLGVIAAAAVYGPRWYRTRAGGTEPPAATGQPPAAAQQPAVTAPPAATPPLTTTPAVVPAAETKPPAEATAPPAPAEVKVRKPMVLERRATAPPPGETPATAVTPAAVQAPPAQRQAAPPATSPQPAVDTSALEEQRERLSTFAAVANSLRSSLQNLEAQQRASGLGLRTDVSTVWKRMEVFLDEAEAALKRGDAAAAKKNLDAAEREADKLDKFLGH